MAWRLRRKTGRTWAATLQSFPDASMGQHAKRWDAQAALPRQLDECTYLNGETQSQPTCDTQQATPPLA
jgi:hypothetical protein